MSQFLSQSDLPVSYVPVTLKHFRLLARLGRAPVRATNVMLQPDIHLDDRASNLFVPLKWEPSSAEMNMTISQLMNDH